LIISKKYTGTQTMEVTAQLLEILSKIKQNIPEDLISSVYLLKTINKYKLSGKTK